MRALPALVVASLALAACGTVATPGTPPNPDGRTFLSTAVTGHELVEGTQLRLSFEDGQLSVQAGCNQLFGQYSIEGGALAVDTMGATEMGCDPALMDQDTWVMGFLQDEPRITLEGDELTLATDDVEVQLLDRVVASPDRPLIGTTWVLNSHYSGDAVVNALGFEDASIVFAEDSLSVDTGCNTGRASYSVEDDVMAIGPLMMTRMACSGPAAEVEPLIVGALDGASLTVAITEAGLTLKDEDGKGLGFLAQE